MTKAAAIPEVAKARWRTAGLWGDLTLGTMMLEQACQAPDVDLVVGSQERPSTTRLADFAALALAGAASLQDLGIGPDAVVAVSLPNWLETAVAHAAIALAGAVTVTVMPDTGMANLRFMAQQARIDAIITPGIWRGRDYALPVAELRAELGGQHLRHHLVVGDSAAPDALHWDTMICSGTAPRAVTIEPDALALIVYTSGTTAAPKGVRHSHRTLLAEQLTETDSGRKLSPWPPGHISGYVNIMRFWAGGRPTVLMDRWDAQEAARLIESCRVTASSGTPTHLNALLDAAQADQRDISSLVDYLAGATAIPPALILRCKDQGLSTYRCFGMSEHPTITRGNPQDSLELRTGTDGRPCPGTEVRILDDTDSEVAPGIVGNVVCRGPERFLGYVDAALDDECFLEGGWLRTGDLGRLDAEGNLTITGRKKDVILRGGETLSAREIEEGLEAMSEVLEAAVVGIPDVRLGERVCAFVRIRDDARIDLQTVTSAFNAQGISRVKTPERVIQIDAFPLTDTGKIRKQALREMLEPSSCVESNP